jgi:type VI secretion system (T6SS) spike protein VgrG3
MSRDPYFGGNTSLIEKALNGKDSSKLSDKDIVTAIQGYKIKNNDSLFRSSSSAVRSGTANRAVQEKDSLVSLINGGDVSSIANVAQSAVPAAGSTPRVPSIPKINDAPVVAEPLSSSSGNRSNQQVTVTSQNEVGQDVKDRKIAHIVTGGLSD